MLPSHRRGSRRRIQCLWTGNLIDFDSHYLLNLQDLRVGTISDNISLLLSAFYEKEPEFTAKAIDFLITSYKDMAHDCAVFEPPQRNKKVKRWFPDTHPDPLSASQHSGEFTIKRRRYSSPSHSLSPSITTSLVNEGSSTITLLNQPSSSKNIKFIALNSFVPDPPPRQLWHTINTPFSELISAQSHYPTPSIPTIFTILSQCLSLSRYSQFFHSLVSHVFIDDANFSSLLSHVTIAGGTECDCISHCTLATGTAHKISVHSVHQCYISTIPPVPHSASWILLSTLIHFKTLGLNCSAHGSTHYNLVSTHYC